MSKCVEREEVYQRKGVTEERGVDTVEIRRKIEKTLEWERNQKLEEEIR